MAVTRLRVVVAHRPPFVFVTNSPGSSSGNTPFISGMLIELLNRILSTIETPLKYDLYVSPSNAGGTLQASGNWSGALGTGSAAPLLPRLLPSLQHSACVQHASCQAMRLQEPSEVLDSPCSAAGVVGELVSGRADVALFPLTR